MFVFLCGIENTMGASFKVFEIFLLISSSLVNVIGLIS